MRPRFICRSSNFSITRQFYSLLIDATITDNSGEEVDTLDLTFDDRNNQVSAPKEGAVLEPLFGYAETGLTSMGKFTVTRIMPRGGDSGETLGITAEAIDFRSGIKEKMSEHFEDTTVEKALKEVFDRHKVPVRVDPEIGQIKLEYEPRWNQSAVDFATRLAERYNGIAKAVNNGFVIVKKGSAKSPGGSALSKLIIDKDMCSDWDFDIAPRPRHGTVVAKWFDRDAGKNKFVTEKTGEKGPRKVLPHTYKTEDEAKQAAKSAGTDANRKTGSGSFTLAGDPSRRAEADVEARNGWRPEIKGDWRCTSLTHEYSDGGYINTVSVEAPEEQKKGAE